MKVSQLLEQRRQNWRELEQLCDGPRRGRSNARSISRFASLYRAACADLALADAYQLPPDTVQYLHRLVGRAHNQLYQTKPFQISAWAQALLVDAPRRIFQDRCVQLAFCIFWGAFLTSFFLAQSKAAFPAYAEEMLSQEVIEQLESNFSESLRGRDPSLNYAMAGFYIQHNTGIGFKCFSSGLLVVPGLFICLYNAAFLGAAFGYMARPGRAGGREFLPLRHGAWSLRIDGDRAGHRGRTAAGLVLGPDQRPHSAGFAPPGSRRKHAADRRHDGAVLPGRIDRRVPVPFRGTLLGQGGGGDLVQRCTDVLFRRAGFPEECEPCNWIGRAF